MNHVFGSLCHCLIKLLNGLLSLYQSFCFQLGDIQVMRVLSSVFNCIILFLASGQLRTHSTAVGCRLWALHHVIQWPSITVPVFLLLVRRHSSNTGPTISFYLYYSIFSFKLITHTFNFCGMGPYITLYLCLTCVILLSLRDIFR